MAKTFGERELALVRHYCEEFNRQAMGESVKVDRSVTEKGSELGFSHGKSWELIKQAKVQGIIKKTAI